MIAILILFAGLSFMVGFSLGEKQAEKRGIEKLKKAASDAMDKEQDEFIEKIIKKI